MTRLTNTQFAARTACDFTTASRLRRGDRRPSLALMARMWKEFDLDANEAFGEYLKGHDAFTAYLNRHIFEAADEPERAPIVCPSCGELIKPQE